MLLFEVRPDQRFDYPLVSAIDLQIFESVLWRRDLCDAVDVRREELAGSERVSDQALW